MESNHTRRIDDAAWLTEQAELLRAGRLQDIDAEGLEKLINDAHQRLESELFIVTVDFLWFALDDYVRQGSDSRVRWRVREQQDKVLFFLRRRPSLRQLLDQPDWIRHAFDEATGYARHSIPLGTELPATCPWKADELLDPKTFPAPEENS